MIAHYGLLITRPSMYARFVEPPPPTFREIVHGLVVEGMFLVTQALLFALSVSGFALMLSAFS